MNTNGNHYVQQINKHKGWQIISCASILVRQHQTKWLEAVVTKVNPGLNHVIVINQTDIYFLPFFLQAEEAREHCKACQMDVGDKRVDLANNKSEIITQIREVVSQCDLTLKAVSSILLVHLKCGPT